MVHARINPDGIYMDGPPDDVAAALKKIHDAGKGVIGMKIIGQGRYRDDPANAPPQSATSSAWAQST